MKSLVSRRYVPTAVALIVFGASRAYAEPNDEYAVAQSDECRLTLSKAKAGSDDWRLMHGEPIRPPYFPSRCGALDDWRLAHGFRRETRPRLRWLIPGAAIFGVFYVATVITAAGNGNVNGDTALYVPVAGPFVMMGFKIDSAAHPVQGGCGTAQGCGSNQSSEAFAAVIFGLDGIAQLVGVSLFVAGFARETVLAKVRVVPVVSQSLTGLSLSLSL